LKIGKSDGTDGLRPHVKYVGNMHGNEVSHCWCHDCTCTT